MDCLSWQTADIMELGDLSTVALFLDLDGTLIDIAQTPDAVVIPLDLTTLLEAAALKSNGAFAILTGRPIAEVDRYLAPLSPVAGGVHGAEIRAWPGGAIELSAQPIDERIVAAVCEIARHEPGVIVELKPASVALHYRLALSAEARIEEALQRVLDDGPDHLIVCRGRKVLEILPTSVSKGSALERIMLLPEFRDRRPIMIGDDISDASAFEAAARLGGLGLKVAGEQFGTMESDFAGPAAVRAWLAEQTGRHR